MNINFIISTIFRYFANLNVHFHSSHNLFVYVLLICIVCHFSSLRNTMKICRTCSRISDPFIFLYLHTFIASSFVWSWPLLWRCEIIVVEILKQAQTTAMLQIKNSNIQRQLASNRHRIYVECSHSNLRHSYHIPNLKITFICDITRIFFLRSILRFLLSKLFQLFFRTFMTD